MTCVACHQPTYRARSARYCWSCLKAAQRACNVAIYAVRKAVTKGAIPPATALSCADCGRPAKFYDHRDYSRPLDVQPVCWSCNVRRGPAVAA